MSLQLKVRGSHWCCHICGSTVQMTHPADNLKTASFIWYSHFLLLCHFPKVKVSGHVTLILCVWHWFSGFFSMCQQFWLRSLGFVLKTPGLTFPFIPAKKAKFYIGIIHQICDFMKVKWWVWILLPQWFPWASVVEKKGIKPYMNNCCGLWGPAVLLI